MAKALCLTGMIVAILLMVLFTVDFFLQWPFKAFDGKWILDSTFLVASAGLTFLSWSAWREQE
jgi:sensor domain CHASE-containing protein|tara:strand:+ start:207 stop:395 length:189 start_codon:yes stop_codon:yes gene_type:complete